MKLIYALLFTALTVDIAYAQPPAPPFEPYTVTEQMHQALFDHLYRNVPQIYADPIRQALAQWEQQAQQRKATEAKKGSEKENKK